jgi:hypothetical protein
MPLTSGLLIKTLFLRAFAIRHPVEIMSYVRRCGPGIHHICPLLQAILVLHVFIRPQLELSGIDLVPTRILCDWAFLDWLIQGRARWQTLSLRWGS